MRQFGRPVGPEIRTTIIELATKIYDLAPIKRESRADAFAMEDDPDQVMVREAEVKWPEGRLRVAITTEAARPPFEWLYEITSNIGETDYFKHYLVRDEDVVLAQRKILTPLDGQEAEVVLADLKLTLAELENVRAD